MPRIISPTPVDEPPSTPYAPAEEPLPTPGRPDVVDPGTPGEGAGVRQLRTLPGVGRWVQTAGPGRPTVRMTQLRTETLTTGDGDTIEVVVMRVRIDTVTTRPVDPSTQPPAGEQMVVEYEKTIPVERWSRALDAVERSGQTVTEGDA